jgi:hypothetical protein
LDQLLDDLEDLNMKDMTYLPTRIGSVLLRFGVTDPYRWSIAELIEQVFTLQEPLMVNLRDGWTTRKTTHANGPPPVHFPDQNSDGDIDGLTLVRAQSNGAHR